nr:MUTS family DNA binding domain protein [Mimivirus sp.]
MSDNKILCDIGYVYIVTSPVINACKIGFWRSNLKSLRSRYVTSYGNNLILHTFLTKNAYKLEQLCHKYFVEYNISNELFDKKYINKYIKFLNKNYDPVQNNYLDNELNKQIDEESESDYESDEENESDYESDEECNEESDEESESDYENDEESDKESESDDESNKEVNEEYYKVFMDILKEKDAEIKEKIMKLKIKIVI